MILISNIGCNSSISLDAKTANIKTEKARLERIYHDIQYWVDHGVCDMYEYSLTDTIIKDLKSKGYKVEGKYISWCD